jgi:flagellar M-ring protein FliF
LLPKQLAVNNFSDVSVSFFESLTPEPFDTPSAASNAMVWASQNFNTLTMAGVALVSLVMLRSMVKGVPAPESAPATGTPTLSIAGATSVEAKSEADQEEEPEDPQRPRLRLKKGKSLSDELTLIVKEDPDSAAAILRTWISNAG